MNNACKFILLFTMLFSFLLTAQEETRLLRFPATNGQQIVFTYAGDLYTVDKTGGIARRLTNHDGFEMFPRFSPNGDQLAFTGQYDGNTEVFLMPAQGGVPERLTYTATLTRDDIGDRMGPNNIVMAWKNQSPEIAFRSRMRSYNDFNGSLFTVSTDGGLPQQIEVPRGGFCSFSPDDQKMAYNRIFASSAPGNAIAAAWRMMSGFSIFKRSKSKTSPIIRHRTSFRCGPAIRFTFSQTVMPINE